MSFEKWLVQHKKQNNAIGDLSRDFIDSGCQTVESSFEKYTPCEDAIDTYYDARKAYVFELANDLHDELSNILGRKDSNDNEWDIALVTIYRIMDNIADLEDYFRNESEVTEDNS